MDFVQRIRHQIKFDTEKQLANQIKKDCKKSKEYFNRRIRGGRRVIEKNPEIRSTKSETNSNVRNFKNGRDG